MELLFHMKWLAHTYLSTEFTLFTLKSGICHTLESITTKINIKVVVHRWLLALLLRFRADSEHSKLKHDSQRNRKKHDSE